MWKYTPRQLQAWLELIERDLALDKADAIESAAVGNVSGSKKGNKAVEDATKKLRSNI